ncbi:DUF3422 domain-containing protein [Undibacterium sp. TS12]|uniref:DUF3422 family protein n=1 Tax=Undibacterium sp. TS12 TaxID=2908202 RepID=UPI001F4CD6EE|nr:DUF3422 domain-containing protein [Undibacterium sp. TS12]MCH8618783.1 DUF3422 domain-containing protein [Undibacterium sp. TS12]
MSIAYSKLNHPLRVPLAAEVHSRPSLRLHAPETLTHFAIFARNDAHLGGDNLLTQQVILGDFCRHFAVAAPAGDAKYFFHDFGRFRMKWECHTEFATYTFVENAPEHEGGGGQELELAQIFASAPIRHLPQQWLFELQDKVMVATHVALLPADQVLKPSVPVRQIFEGGVVVGSEVLSRGTVWTDFLIQADGFSRFIVSDNGFIDQQAGRTVQRLLEIETYRMMALLGLPYAQKASPILSAIENELVTLTSALTMASSVSGEMSSTEAEQNLLRHIIDLAVRTEKLTLENSYRFAASKAYYKLVQSRIGELREFRIEGVPTVQEFMDRRLAPAMNTCEAIVRRQETLAERIANTNDLLRTRVGIVQEQQNRKILQSMNARAAQQLRLQQAVEGLSVVAISYYMTGLVYYGAKGLKSLGLPINPDMAAGLLLPVIAGVVWWGLRKLHKQMH